MKFESTIKCKIKNTLFHRRWILFFLFTLNFSTARATHNRAGEITYTQISAYMYCATITTYTNINPGVTADRDRLVLYWGDGDSCEVTRKNGPDNNGSGIPDGEPIGNGTKKNVYTCCHTYAGPGVYTMTVFDQNRNEGVVNIPNSVQVPFYVETTLVISPFLGFNTSPVLLNPPIDRACTCKRFVHNPGCYDVDGDSLSYSMLSCKGTDGLVIPGYSLPSGISINAITGDFVWDCPSPTGEFNFAFLISEWRNGVVIGTITRDMQVTVEGNCRNDPPEIVPRDVCAEAGTKITFDVVASDPNGDPIDLTSTGGPYLLTNSPASFTPPTSTTSPVTGQFAWQTNCSHIRSLPYQVSFKAEDDGGMIRLNIPNPNNVTTLTDLENVNIRIVAPAPTNLQAGTTGFNVSITWNQSSCSETVGYKLYRRKGCGPVVHGPCETGVPASAGYTLIATLNGLDATSYLDNKGDLSQGEDYSYVVIATYSDGTESFVSLPVCIHLKKDSPIITNVSVMKTSSAAGEDSVAWSEPTEIDTLIFPKPYRYYLYRAKTNDLGNFALVGTTSDFYLKAAAQSDTMVLDKNNLNTVDNGNTYRVEIYSVGAQKTVGSSQNASSIYLTLSPGDNKLRLNWAVKVPWTNSSYEVYKYKTFPIAGFVKIATVTDTFYVDNGLVNGVTYCYLIRSVGKYSSPELRNPIINYSQEVCGVPIDNEKPCPPVLSITPDCPNILNTLKWTNPNRSCADDVLQYKVYYTQKVNGAFDLIKEMIIESGSVFTHTETVFNHNDQNISIAGCYVVTGIDSANNESNHSDTVCIDNCPLYEFPNVFTPNGDGINDYFIPIPELYRYIRTIDLKIYNRWGGLVFETTNPDVLWDGVDVKTGQPCFDDVYYYVCRYTTIRLGEDDVKNLRSYVHLFKEKVSNDK